MAGPSPACPWSGWSLRHTRLSKRCDDRHARQHPPHSLTPPRATSARPKLPVCCRRKQGYGSNLVINATGQYASEGLVASIRSGTYSCKLGSPWQATRRALLAKEVSSWQPQLIARARSAPAHRMVGRCKVPPSFASPGRRSSPASPWRWRSSCSEPARCRDRPRPGGPDEAGTPGAGSFGLGAGLWWLVSNLLALVAGGYTAAWLAGNTPSLRRHAAWHRHLGRDPAAHLLSADHGDRRYDRWRLQHARWRRLRRGAGPAGGSPQVCR